MVDHDDIEFLLVLATSSIGTKPKSGMSPVFYFTGTYESDLAMWNRLQRITEENTRNRNDPSGV